jgi:hypothetical protein
MISHFKFLEFNPIRHSRGAPAARVEVWENDRGVISACDWLWMTKSDIKKNILEWGEDPGLLEALSHYER